MLHGSILMPSARTYIPVSLIPFQTAVSVPETFQLEGISPNPFNLLTPVEPTTMPDAFRVLAFGLKEKSRRLAQSIMTSPVTTHTGYGQAGVFNPDGATLYTQNWHTRLMPATRMDDPRDAGSDLARQARSAFDELADDLQKIQSTSSWGRVNAH